MEFHKRSFIFIVSVTLLLSSLNFLPTSPYLIAETDRLVLLAFRENINDPSGALSSWNESSHCSNWTGIICGRRHPTRVVGLDLRSMSLEGSISPHIGNLSFLKHFVLYDNHFTGGIPEEISHLSRLLLANNSLTVKIPRNLSSCKSLTDLVLTRNDLVGGIHVELGSLSMLQLLQLGGELLRRNHPNFTFKPFVSHSNSSRIQQFTR